MRFWDTSALVTLLAHEPHSPAAQHLYAEQPVVVWWATVVECASALARLERDGMMSAAEASECFDRLDALRSGWVEVEPGDELREVARRMLRVHALRAADAMQLAAAWLAAERRPATLPIVTLDARLRDAARREGFPLVTLT